MCSGGSVYKGEREKYWHLICNNLPARSPNHYENGARIKYETLVEIVHQDLNRVLRLSDRDIQKIMEVAVKEVETQSGTTSPQEQIGKLQRRINDIDKIISKLYQDNVSGKIDDSRLERMVADLESESHALTEKLARLQKGITDAALDRSSYDTFFALAKECRHIDTLTREILVTFND